MQTFLSASGWLIGVCSLGLSIYFYQRARIIARLVCINKATSKIFFPKDSETFKPTIAGMPVGTVLNFTQLHISNAGNSTIDKSDQRKPLSIGFEIKEGTVLGAYTTAPTKGKMAAIKIGVASPNVTLDWDYFDVGDSANIYVYSTGEITKIRFDGHFSSKVKIITKMGDSKIPSSMFAVLIIIELSVGGAFVEVLLLKWPLFSNFIKILKITYDSLAYWSFSIIAASLLHVAAATITISGLGYATRLFNRLRLRVTKETALNT